MAKWAGPSTIAWRRSASKRRFIDYGVIAGRFERKSRIDLLTVPSTIHQPFAHMRRYRRNDSDRRAVLIKRHHDLAGVQMQYRAALARRRAVDRVAHYRPAHFGAMDAKLVRASGQRFERKPCHGARWRSSHHLPLGRRRLTLRIVLHPPAARFVEAAEW